MPRRSQQDWRPGWSPNRPQPAPNVTRSYNNDTRTLVEKYGRMAAPFFRIQINDKDNRTLFSSESAINESGYDLEGLLIYEVEYDETDCQTSMIRLNMANPNMDLQDGLIFTEGNTIDLWMGYDGLEPDYMGRGFIVEISPTFEAADIPRFSVVAYDISHFLMEEGRGDIIPEGTAWYERKRKTKNITGQEEQRNSGGGTGDDNRNDTNPNRSQDGNVGTQTRASNRGNGTIVCEGDQCQSVMAPTSNPSRTQQNTNNTANQEVSRSEWVRWKNPRRGRNNGKIWKAKSDSEIVDSIFDSYGIIPYSTATNESRATVRTITVSPEDDAVESAGNTAIEDTLNEAENKPSEVARAAERLNPGVDITNVAIESGGGAENINLTKTPVNNIPKLQPGETATITTREERRVTQKNGTSDWDFVKELARKRGYIVYVFFHYDSGRWMGYWGPDNGIPQQQTYTFKYAQGDSTSLARVKPTISLREQKTEIDLQYVDPRSGKENLLRVSMDNVSPVYSQIRRNSSRTNIDPIGDGPEVTLNIFGKRTSVVADRNFSSAEDARDWLISFWIRHARDFCRIEGKTIIGLPEMRARQHHLIEGIGRMSGNFFITKAVHRMGANKVYETDFNGFRKFDTPFNSSNVETESVDLGDWAPPSSDTTTQFSR